MMGSIQLASLILIKVTLKSNQSAKSSNENLTRYVTNFDWFLNAISSYDKDAITERYLQYDIEMRNDKSGRYSWSKRNFIKTTRKIFEI